MSLRCFCLSSVCVYTVYVCVCVCVCVPSVLLAEHLTVAAVLASVPQGAVAGERLPAHTTRPSVLAGVGLAEGQLGTAAYQKQVKQ